MGSLYLYLYLYAALPSLHDDDDDDDGRCPIGSSVVRHVAMKTMQRVARRLAAQDAVQTQI